MKKRNKKIDAIEKRIEKGKRMNEKKNLKSDTRARRDTIENIRYVSSQRG